MEYQKLINFLSNIEKISAFPFIIILRNSMINIVPIIIVGSFFLLFFVLMRQYGIAVEYLEFFRKLYLLTMGFVSVYLSVSIGYNYANHYDRDRIIYCLVSLVCFLVSVLIYHDWKNSKATEFISFLGVKNMFSSIVISLLSCYIFSKVRIDVFMDKSVPDYIRSSLNSIVPFFITIFFVSLLAFFLRFNEFLTFLLVPFERYGDNILVVWVTNIFLHLTNFLGIHGISLINSVFLSLWQGYLVKNAELVMNHAQPIYITAYPFFQWFLWIGGAGSTLGLNVILLFSKNDYLRTIGRSSIVPSVFNINEPLLFGLPIVLNPYFLVPFVITPLILGTLSFFVFYFGLVGKPYIEAPWMFPSPVGAFLSTTDYRAVLLNILNVFISAMIYLPFLKAYEKKLEKDNKKNTQNCKKTEEN
ncbi:MAG: PTS transporter subunit EIIC [Candidatus Calescibacterium sp.]|nr:PTS transporter subunit EIIC [Candidatus Calescibacterium sp.]